MKPGIKNFLITGKPGCGKTTLFKRLVKRLEHLNPVGFYTQEIREGGIRKGFTLNGLDGSSGLLAHVDFSDEFKVGRYGVDVAGFDKFIRRLRLRDNESRLIMIDEIGKMECFSADFESTVAEILDSERILVATVARKGSGLIAEIKKRSDIRIFEATHRNQDLINTRIVNLVCSNL